MEHKNYLINNTLNKSNVFNSSESNHWFDIQHVNETTEFCGQVESIYQQCRHLNKWILVVNPEAESLSHLQQSKAIDCSKILCVHSKKSSLKLKNIEKTLNKGNCAAVVICDSDLDNHKIAKLENCAQAGKTHCIFINKSKQLH